MTNSEKDKSQKSKNGYLKRLWDDAKSRTDTAKFWIEVIALIVLCVYTYCAWQQANAALTANRPYVGVNGVEFSHSGENASGQVITSGRPTNETSNFHFAAQMKNFGPVPGTNFFGRWRIFLAGVELPEQKLSDHPYTIFPSQIIRLPGIIGSRDYHALVSGEKTLIFEVTIEYDGPNGHYRECSKHQYVPEINDFFNLGPLCTD